MHQGRAVFAQLMDWLPKHEFDCCVERYRGNLVISSQIRPNPLTFSDCHGIQIKLFAELLQNKEMCT